MYRAIILLNSGLIFEKIYQGYYVRQQKNSLVELHLFLWAALRTEKFKNVIVKLKKKSYLIRIKYENHSNHD